MWPAQISDGEQELRFTIETERLEQQVIDEETSLVELLNAAKAGHHLEISFDGQAFPLVVDKELDKLGAETTANTQTNHTTGVASDLGRLLMAMIALLVVLNVLSAVRGGGREEREDATRRGRE